jgi:hypothetical protein
MKTRRILAGLCLACCLAASAAAQGAPAAKADFSGTWVLDGQETDFAPALVGGGTGKGRRTSRWAADGRAFDVTEQATVPGDDGEEEIKATRRWSLSADAKTLTIEITLNGPMGEYKSRRLFARK